MLSTRQEPENKKVTFLTVVYTVLYWITQRFPYRGARFIDRGIIALLGNRFIGNILFFFSTRSLKGGHIPEKICVLVDVNIGDAVMNQGIVSILRSFFPKAQIDYVIKKSAYSLIAGNPNISSVYGVYTGAPVPNQGDISIINKLFCEVSYDIIFNFCPFIYKKSLTVSSKTAVVSFLGMIPLLMRRLRDNHVPAHMLCVEYQFIRHVCSYTGASENNNSDCKPSILISPQAIQAADNFLKQNNISTMTPVIFINMDTSSRFTRIPLNIQTILLKKIINLPGVILLGVGRLPKKIIRQVLNEFSQDQIKKIKVIFNTAHIDTYAALIDRSDVYITGDTGPMHIAAAWKYTNSKAVTLRNKTAIFSIFGATPSRVYGYDSTKDGFYAANQDAISKVYIGDNQYRNIAYINKHDIVCDPSLFFRQLNVNKIVEDIRDVVCAPSNLIEKKGGDI